MEYVILLMKNAYTSSSLAHSVFGFVQVAISLVSYYFEKFKRTKKVETESQPPMALSRQDLPESAHPAFCWCCVLSPSYCPVCWVIGKSVANSTKQEYFVCNGNITTCRTSIADSVLLHREGFPQCPYHG